MLLRSAESEHGRAGEAGAQEVEWDERTKSKSLNATMKRIFYTFDVVILWLS